MRGGWVYIMANKPFGTTYIGVTANLPARVHQHKSGTGSIHCRDHGLHHLVYAEEYPTIAEAIAREKAMKKWKRRWKTDLISKANPDWSDLLPY
ncbi:GIY-YIG nuclease family protein [Novosphingopyxis baekryungensis]|jgi:putative endonuclease|uniref:GIY-YIG nuclease family protein n=1 Tax=Novosphingopyxis baekryungensis TaxID=279369 RepID=UPI0003B33324|nr:GIY-YIG nuclease family protein [Novosphingopyxis baekryungensis]